MEVVYTLRKDVVTKEESDTIVYGINVHRITGELSEIVPDVFTDKEEAKKFISLCNSEKLESVHLYDVIADLHHQ